ncbi:MAG: hypothetical protein LBR32_00950 [Propionibacteriaceae bacterium]|jgi:hypothetical protein|nr:hypothetical protein [Propionibacteriaceae bacterium]
MAVQFDDARLDDADALAAADNRLRTLALAGARLRRAMLDAEPLLSELAQEPRPRAIVAFGTESRLLRAVLEPTCPAPFVAWPRLGLPAWVGAIDLVVTMGATNPVALAAAREAVRRGCRVVVACPPDSELAMAAGSRDTTWLPGDPADMLSTAIIVLDALRRLGLGPVVDAEGVADSMDLVASECAARRDVAENPAKRVALELADVQPLVWGGSILAARASRRVAEALREATGRVVLSADADILAPLIRQAPPSDLFADPFDQADDCRPGLVVLDDGLGDELAVREAAGLQGDAQAAGVRVSRLDCLDGDRVTRYACLLQRGLFAAAYLGVGLGRYGKMAP